jgi:membrane fusion protein (multidrug efflux system)
MSEPHTNKKAYAVAGLTVVIAAAIATGAGRVWRSSDRTTDDAFVSADFTVVAPRVAGQIESLAVEDNQVVRKGQLLAQIDDRDYTAALDSAQANVAIARATIANVSASLAQQQSAIDQADAALASSRAGYVFAQADLDRYTDLAKHGATSTQNAQQARSRIETARAAVARDEAGLRAARQQVAVLSAQQAQAQANLQHAQASWQAAQLSQSWTRIVAPVDGVVGQRSVRVGSYVTPGNPLLAIVPVRQAYVVANFQETQLTDVRNGQQADIHIDTYPGVILHGTVDSLAPATGATFAALAADNATGNFTKVVQRIPVKIVLQPGQPAIEQLRVGMSVEATIHTDRAAASTAHEVAAR